MTRFVEDARSRERIQALLSRLRGHPAEVWWLSQPGILETRRRDAVFPVLGLFVPAALLLTLVWSPALVAVILGVITNMIVRYATAPRLGPPLHPFRQVAPLLAAAEIARPLIASHGLPIGPSLSSDLARLRRLRRIAGWVGHDPMMSDDLTSAIHEAANMILLLDLALLVLASREIRANGPALLRTVASVGTVDAAIGVASYRTTQPRGDGPGCAHRRRGHRRRLLPHRSRRVDASRLRAAVRRLDAARATSPAAAGSGAELHRAGPAAGGARHRIQHVRQVHVSQDRRRDRDSGADRQHLSGDVLPRPGPARAKRHRPRRRSDGGPELLSGRGRGSAVARARKSKHPPPPLPVRRALPRHQHGRTHCRGRGDAARFWNGRTLRSVSPTASMLAGCHSTIGCGAGSRGPGTR